MIEFGKYFSPMLLKEIAMPFDSQEYIFELKFDGLRATIHADSTKIIIYNRHHNDITKLFPELEVIKTLVSKPTIFDGEIVLFQNGRPSFSKLQERSHLKNNLKIEYFSKNYPVTYVVFDIIYEAKDITNLSLAKRKQKLSKYPENDYFLQAKFVKNRGVDLFKKVTSKNLEGIVAKKIDSTYEINTRTSNWLKIKNSKYATFFIGAYLRNKNNTITLVLGEYQNNKLKYVGKIIVGPKNSLYKMILSTKQLKKTPFIDYQNSQAFYINPNLTCQVKYMERTKNNHLRQAYLLK